MTNPPPALLRSRPVRAIASHSLTRRGAHRLVRTLDLPASDSFEAFLQALARQGWDTPTRCKGWAVHDLLAHLAAGSAEIADLATLTLRDEPVRATRGFAEREAPFRDLRPARLRRRFIAEAMRATAAIIDLARRDLPLPFTGINLAPGTLAAHVDAELILHRWDMTGDDEVSIGALSRPDVVRHAVDVVAAMQPNVMPFQITQGPVQAVRAILRAEGQDDVVLEDGTVRVGVAADLPVVDFHPAARTLALWGRQSTGALPSPSGDPALVAAAMQALAIRPRS